MRRMRGRWPICGILILVGIGTAGTAQAAPNGINPGGAPPSAPKTCVQVQIAGQQPSPYNCLNQQLQQQAASAQGRAVAVAPLGAGGQSNALGIFNEQGVREQYGQNFGKSAIPYRPPPPVFSSGVP